VLDEVFVEVELPVHVVFCRGREACRDPGEVEGDLMSGFLLEGVDGGGEQAFSALHRLYEVFVYHKSITERQGFVKRGGTSFFYIPSNKRRLSGVFFGLSSLSIA
jgi:hypothetical protein